MFKFNMHCARIAVFSLKFLFPIMKYPFLACDLLINRAAFSFVLRYGVMLRCWNANPKTRPTFEELSEELHRMHRQETVGRIVCHFVMNIGDKKEKKLSMEETVQTNMAVCVKDLYRVSS